MVQINAVKWDFAMCGPVVSACKYGISREFLVLKVMLLQRYLCNC